MAQTLADIMASPESMRRAAEDFMVFCDAQEVTDDGMNLGVKNDADFTALLERCGCQTDPAYYKNFCKIGEND